MVFYGLYGGLQKTPYAPNVWRHDVVPAVWCIRSFCERKLIHSHPNNARHPFFQPNCKSIIGMPMNVKQFDNFFRQSFGHFSSKFRPKLWISFFVHNAKFHDFVHFSSKTIFLCPYASLFEAVLPRQSM